MQAQELISIVESLNKPSFSLSEIILIVRGRCADKGFLEEPGSKVEFPSEHLIYEYAIDCINGDELSATKETATNKSGEVFTRYRVKPSNFLLWAMREQNKGAYKIIDPDVGKALIELFDDKDVKGIPSAVARELLKDERIKQMMIRFKKDKSSHISGKIISEVMGEMPELDKFKQAYIRAGKGMEINRQESFLKAVRKDLEKLTNSNEFNDLLGSFPVNIPAGDFPA